VGKFALIQMGTPNINVCLNSFFFVFRHDIIGSWWLFTRGHIRFHHGQKRFAEFNKNKNFLYKNSHIFISTGNGDIGVSNSLGANSLSILFSLGLPWFIRIMKNGGPFTNANINIQSDGMEYVVISLIAAVATLYLILTFSSYKLRKTVGIVLAAAYALFVAFPLLVEMNIIFPSDNKC
jgi:hypothetical protein